MDTVKPIKDQVIVRQDSAKETIGSGVLFAAQGCGDHPPLGTVIAVGPGAIGADGERIPMDSALVPGARVMFKRRPSTALEPYIHETAEPRFKDLLTLREDDIIGIVEAE